MRFLSFLHKAAAGVGDAIAAAGERHAAEVAAYAAKSDVDLLSSLRFEVRSGWRSGRAITIMCRLAEQRGLNISDIRAEARRIAAREAKTSR